MAPLEKDFPGYWGKPTSTLDWCESNYEITHYIAEFWNTLSNVGLILPPLLGLMFCMLDGLEHRFILCHFSLALVGFGSCAFHGTLLYNMQLLDELPMLWGSSLLVYCLLENPAPRKTKNFKLGVFLLLYCSSATWIYLTVKNPVFHQVAYGILVLSLVLLSMKLIRKHPYRKDLIIGGVFMYSLGFILWNIDNIFCSNLRVMRGRVGTLVSPLLQLHAWWHILAGFGTYCALVFCMEMRLRILKRPYTYQKVLGIIAVPRCVDSTDKSD